MEAWLNKKCFSILMKLCSYQDAKCLVTTGHDKYFSTGVDTVLFESSSQDSIAKILSALQQLLYRLLTFPLVTVAAINGKDLCRVLRIFSCILCNYNLGSAILKVNYDQMSPP